ncbi:unnamed protein product [Symbiodinium microadriaticum]|nr:unnamed protein product [Symbiodinium microadriaticum]
MPELSAASRTRIELISSKHRGRLFTISVPHQIMRRTAQHSVIPPDAQSDDGLTCFSKSVLSVEAYREQTQGRAATTIQLWYRSLSAMQRAVGAMPTNSPYSASLSKRSIREILRAILIFILRSRMHQRENVAAISYQQVSAIIEELVCNAVDYCYRRDQLAEGSMKVSISGRSPSMMGGAPGDPQKKAKKSLAEKLLKKGKKKFKKILGK